MLCLSWQIRCDPCGLRGFIRNNEDLRGTGDHVDRDLSEHLALCGRDEDIAGTRDLVHRCDAFSSVGESRDRLCAADLVDLGDARNVRSAARMWASILPLRSGGVVIAMEETPATDAGIAFIRTVEG